MDKQIEVFICYDSNNSVLAQEYCTKLRQEGISANIDSIIIHAGDNWVSKIEDAIRNSDVAMLILTTDIKENSFVYEELKIIAECGIPIIPFAPNGFKKRTSLTDKELQILNHSIGDNLSIGDIQYTNSFEDAVITLQQRALEYKLVHNSLRSKLGTSIKEFMRFITAGYLSNSDSPFILLLLYQYPESAATLQFIEETITQMRSMYSKSSVYIKPYIIPKTIDSKSGTKLKELLESVDGVIVIDSGEMADYSEVVKWSERRVNVNKPVMRYIPPEVKEENKQSDKLKRFDEIEDISNLTSLLRIASVRSNKALLYLRRANTILLIAIAFIIVSAIVGFYVYDRKEGTRLAASLTESRNISEFTQNIIFGSSDNKCNLIFFKSTPGNRTIKQFFSNDNNDNLQYDIDRSIVGATMRCAEAIHTPFYIVWERTPKINNGATDKCPVIFAAYKDNTGKFRVLPDSCIHHDISGTRLIIDNNEIPVKYQSETPDDHQKLLVACFVQTSSNGNMTALSFELNGNQYNITTKEKLTDINSLERIAAAAKLINWINVFNDESLQPFTNGLSETRYKTLSDNLALLFGDSARVSLFYEKTDSIFYLDGKLEFHDRRNIIGAAMQAPDWYVCYDDGRYSIGKKDTKKLFFRNKNSDIFINDSSLPYFKYDDRNIELYFSTETTASDDIKLLLSIAIRKENKVMGISIDYPKSGVSEERINSIAERAYALLEIVFDAYKNRIPDVY